MDGLEILCHSAVCLIYKYFKISLINLNTFSELNEFPYPIIDDSNRTLAVKLNMLDKDEIGSAGLALTCRAVFVIDHNKKLRCSILYPASSGRNFE